MKKKVAIVHDNLLEYGGSERLLEELIQLYPGAKHFTFYVNHHDHNIENTFGKLKWSTSWVQQLPFIYLLRQYFSFLKPLAWWYFSQLDLSGYQLVITSSHSYNSKLVKTDQDALHICYLHAPPRFLYGYAHELSRITKSKIWKVFFDKLRQIDVAAAQNPDVLIVNSQENQRRAKKLYKRSAEVIYPPVPQLEQQSKQTQKSYYVAHSRLVKQKNIELIVEVCSRYNLPLKVIGDGYLREKLQKSAGESIEFLGFVPDQKLGKVYGSAKALLYAAEDEDFGIVPVEAQSAGVPVIAFDSGGVTETVIDGVTGYFFDQLKPLAMIKAIRRLELHPVSSMDCVKYAARFKADIFRSKIRMISSKAKHLT